MSPQYEDERFEQEKMRETREMFYTPRDAEEVTRDTLMQIQNQKSIGYHIPVTGGYSPAVYPTWLRIVTAQTHNFKTTYFLSEINMNIRNGFLKNDRFVVYITTEEMIEELVAQFVATWTEGVLVRDMFRGHIPDWDGLNIALSRVGNTNIIWFGDSISRDVKDGYGKLTVSNMYRMLKVLVEGKSTLGDIEIAGVYVDYLQALPQDPEAKRRGMKSEEQRRLQVRGDAFFLKDVAKELRIAMTLGSQAPKGLDAKKEWYIPGLMEDHESTDVARRADQKMSLWMPKTTWPVGSLLEYGDGLKYRVTEDLVVMKVWKQKRGLPSGQAFFFKANYGQLTLTEMDAKSIMTRE